MSSFKRGVPKAGWVMIAFTDSSDVEYIVCLPEAHFIEMAREFTKPDAGP